MKALARLATLYVLAMVVFGLTALAVAGMIVVGEKVWGW